MVRILVILGMLVGFLVTMSVALLVAVHFIDWNAQRSWVANRLSDALARPVSIERGLDIALFPSPHIVVRDLMVGTSFADAGFALAKIGHGELRLDLPQLLKGKLEFSSVRLSEVTLNVPAKGQLSRLTFLPVQEIELRSVTIVLPGQGRPSLLISQGLMSWPPEATRGEVKLVGTVSGERVMASGSVGWRMDGDSDPLAVVDLSIGVAATTTTINGVVGHNKMDLALESQTPAFEQLLAWFEWLPSASMRSQLAGSARLKGQLTGPLSAGPRLEINEFEVQLSQVRGTFQGDIFFKSEERDWSAVLEMTASTQDISQFPGHGALWDHLTGPAALQSMVLINPQDIVLSNAIFSVTGEPFKLKAEGQVSHRWDGSATEGEVKFSATTRAVRPTLDALGYSFPLLGQGQAAGRLNLHKRGFSVTELTIHGAGDGWRVDGGGQLVREDSQDDAQLAITLDAELHGASVLNTLGIAFNEDIDVVAHGRLLGSAKAPRIDELELKIISSAFDATVHGQVSSLWPKLASQLDIKAQVPQLSYFSNVIGVLPNVLPELQASVQARVTTNGTLISINQAEGDIRGHGLHGTFTGMLPDTQDWTGGTVALAVQVDDLSSWGLGRALRSNGADGVRVKINAAYSGDRQRPLAIYGQVSGEDWTAQIRSKIESLQATAAYDLELSIAAADPDQLVGFFAPTVTLPGPVTARASLQGQFDQWETSQGRLEISGDGIDVVLDGHLLVMGKNDRRLGIDLKTDSFSRLGRLFAMSLPDSAPVRLVGSVKRSGTGIVIDSAQFDVGNSDFAGSIEYVGFDDAGRKPRINAQLVSEHFDRKDFQTSATRKSSGMPPEKFFSDRRLVLDWISDNDIHLDYRANTAIVGEHHMKDLELTAVVENGKLVLDEIRADIQGAQMKVTLELDARQRPYDIHYSYQLLGMQVARWLTENEVIQPMTGEVDIEVKLTGKGNSIREVVSHADGYAVMVIHSAKIPRKARILLPTSVLMAALRTINPFAKASPVYNIECGLIGFRIDDGKAFSDHTLALKAKEVTILAAGTIDLATEEIAIAIRPKAREGLGVSTVNLAGIYYRLGGTLAKPVVKAASERILKTGVTLGAAWLSSGLTVLAKGLFDRLRDKGDVCKNAAHRFDSFLDGTASSLKPTVN
ncbi:MAG TPA: AsmA family protein [Gammaproteobacteria bacterium]|nr:AsmA family protein [Gammaproteobacteria bacterium]